MKQQPQGGSVCCCYLTSLFPYYYNKSRQGYGWLAGATRGLQNRLGGIYDSAGFDSQTFPPCFFDFTSLG